MHSEHNSKRDCIEANFHAPDLEQLIPISLQNMHGKGQLNMLSHELYSFNSL